ncbi:class I SAM-dependent methyltransferase [Ornithinimicrobium sufpigmenti]|uniref:class I SAM-dependent methyltransferase n=1 Tax=Ornithinimicrobium sufpigmenti TaxID=2508882 RepID=UPI001035D89C|nr:MULTISPECIES: class I SAM-dependent methyltransferase [unclassified Ornithinimicrobium]
MTGARCTGVDLSPVSLDIARELADRAGQAIRYVEANVLEAAAAVGEQVDLVYTSTGTICWVQDLWTWGRQVAALLRPGGTFFFRDSHPSANSLADHEPRLLAPGYRYFPLPAGQALTYADGMTYTDGDRSLITQPRNYEWPHSVSEVLMALVRAGLVIIEVDEQDDLPWPLHPAMTAEGEAYVLPAPWREQVPMAWSVVARKPASADLPGERARSGGNRAPGRAESCARSGRVMRPVGESRAPGRGESCARSGRVVRSVR